MKKSISGIIKDALLQQGHRSIRIDDTNFFLSLIPPPNKADAPSDRRHLWQRVMMFGLFIITICASLTFIIYASIFFIRDILLFDEKPIVTQTGAIIPQRSCNREQVLFLFNSTDLWAGTGVQLQKGDRIKISHSGGFHSDVADIYIKARINGRLKYPYYSGYGTSDSDGVEKCIYNTTNQQDLSPWERWFGADQPNERSPYFGSILWQITNENSLSSLNQKNIHQIGPSDATTFIKIHNDGELFLSVNDILLTKEVVKKFNENWTNLHDALFAKDTLNSLLRAREQGLDFIGIREGDKKTVLYKKEEVKKHLALHPDLKNIWFKDNVGSMMICIEIERKVHFVHWFTWWYRLAERWMNWACEDRALPAKILLCLLAGTGAAFVLCWWLLIGILLLYHKRRVKRQWLRMWDKLSRHPRKKAAAGE